MWMQKNISIKSISRGFHIITDQVTNQIPEIKTRINHIIANKLGVKIGFNL